MGLAMRHVWRRMPEFRARCSWIWISTVLRSPPRESKPRLRLRPLRKDSTWEEGGTLRREEAEASDDLCRLPSTIANQIRSSTSSRPGIFIFSANLDCIFDLDTKIPRKPLALWMSEQVPDWCEGRRRRGDAAMVSTTARIVRFRCVPAQGAQSCRIVELLAHSPIMSTGSDNRLVTTSLPTDAQLRVIFTVVVVLIVALTVTAPYARQLTHGTEIFVPAYAAAIFMVELTTAAILLATFRVQVSVRLLVLASGYLLSGVLSVPWALTFPSVFQSFGVEQNLQSTAWIAAMRRIGFATAIVGYAAIDPSWTMRSPGRWILATIAGIGVLVASALWVILVGGYELPQFMAGARKTTSIWGYIPALSLAIYVIALATLLARRRSTLDIWMCVVLFSLCVEILLISYLGGAIRLSVGWWSGRFFGLVAAGTVLFVLLAETTGNYMRLAKVAANERRARLNRLTAMETLSASVAHEINQPLSSIVNNANAGLRWLSRDEPRMDKVKEALQTIADEGYRAGKVVSGIRQIFLKGAQERVPVDLKMVIDDVITRGTQDRLLAGVEIVRRFPQGSRFVDGNPVQLGQAVSNILYNAVDAMKDADVRTRRITLRIDDPEPGEIEVSFSDTGPGIESDIADRVFLPFVSGKREGMGMGLMFCQSVIEAHGGRIWIASNGPTGLELRFTLPVAPRALEMKSDER